MQAKLDQLAALARDGKIRELVAVFVPLDLSPAEAAEFASDLEGDKDRWAALAAELILIASGQGVHNIVGNQRDKAEFHFRVPGEREFITREVVFTCIGGDWRAEG